MQRFLNLFISTNCSTSFRWFLHPSSGAQNCTYVVRYCQTITATCCYCGWDSISFMIAVGSSIGLTYLMLCVQFCAPDDGRRNRLKHVEQFIEINRSRKCCILLVELQRYSNTVWHLNVLQVTSPVLVSEDKAKFLPFPLDLWLILLLPRAESR